MSPSSTSQMQLRSYLGIELTSSNLDGSNSSASSNLFQRLILKDKCSVTLIALLLAICEASSKNKLCHLLTNYTKVGYLFWLNSICIWSWSCFLRARANCDCWTKKKRAQNEELWEAFKPGFEKQTQSLMLHLLLYRLHSRQSSHLITLLQVCREDTKILLRVGQEQDSSRMISAFSESVARQTCDLPGSISCRCVTSDKLRLWFSRRAYHKRYKL